MMTNKTKIKTKIDKAFEFLKNNNMPEFIIALVDSMDYGWQWQRKDARDYISEKLEEMKIE